MTKPAVLIGQLTEKEIDDLKEKHKLGVFAVKKSGRIAYFKRPGFDELNAFYAQKNDNAITDGWKSLAVMIFIGGCRELIESPIYLTDVNQKLQESIIGEESELVNL